MMLNKILDFNLFIILIFSITVIKSSCVTCRVISDDDEHTNEITTQNKEPIHKIKNVTENLIPEKAMNTVLEIEAVARLYGTALLKTLAKEGKLSLGQLKKHLRSLESYFGFGNCSCYSYTCGCCIEPFIPEIHLDSKICTNISYLPDDYGFTFTVTVDSHVLINETISVHNPPPICITPPYVEKLVDLCIHFFDVNASKTNLHACAQVELRLKGLILAHYNFGCFDIGPKTIEEFIYNEVKII